MRMLFTLLLLAVMSSAACANLITNGDFDDGDAGWGHNSAWGEYFYTDGDSTIASLGGWGSGTGETWSNTSLWQNTGVVFEADTVYQLIVNWRIPAGESVESVMLAIQDTSASDEWVDIASGWFSNDSEGVWGESVLTFDSADSPEIVGHNIGVGFRLTSSEGAWVHVDNISLVPEPTTLCLVGTGSLLLSRRRKI